MASENRSSYGEFKKADIARGYRRLAPGFLPGQTGDPDHDGDKHYGGSDDYDGEGYFVHKEDGKY